MAGAPQEALWFVFREDLLLVRGGGDPAVPLVDPPEEFGDNVLFRREIGFLDGRGCCFVEPGESIEETIKREVREEVGLEVSDVQYFGSQPWPFPNSLMIGFTAEYAGGELKIESTEIEDAGWYEPGEFPPLPPRVSIARAMIDAFAARHGRA